MNVVQYLASRWVDLNVTGTGYASIDLAAELGHAGVVQFL